MVAGHLGERSSDLIAYYEAVPGVQRAPEGLNPATWMLEVTMPGNEERLGVDFAEVYKQSKLNRWAFFVAGMEHLTTQLWIPDVQHDMLPGLPLLQEGERAMRWMSCTA